MKAHKFEVFDPKYIDYPGEWCKHCNTTRDEVEGLHLPEDASGLTWQEFAGELFECEYCSECGGDVEDHIPCIGPFGLWFAMCKFEPFDGFYFRNGQVVSVEVSQ